MSLKGEIEARKLLYLALRLSVWSKQIGTRKRCEVVRLDGKT